MACKVELTQTDFEKILNNYCADMKIDNFKNISLKSISNEVPGHMSEQYLLTMTTEDDSEEKKLTFFVKAQHSQLETIATFTKNDNIFDKEIYCYTFFLEATNEFPNLDGSFAPKYYYSRKDDFIVFEDLTGVGFKMYNGSYFDLKHLEIVLENIAKLHALSLVFEEKKSNQLGRQYRLTEDYEKCIRETMYCHNKDYPGFQYLYSAIKGLCTLIDLFPEKKSLAPGFKKDLKDLFFQAFEVIKPSKQFRNVLCHGDLYTQNIMFKYRKDVPVECKLLDYQLVRYNPPAHDVLIMIYHNTSRHIHQDSLDYLLKYYYTSLKVQVGKHGIEIENILSEDEFYLSAKQLLPLTKLSKAVYKSLAEVSTDRFKEIGTDPKLYAHIIFGDRSDFLTDEFNKNEAFRNFIDTLIQELQDVFDKNQSVTIEDCYNVLRNKLGTTKYKLVDYKVVEFNKRCGFLGAHSNLKLKVIIDDQLKDYTFFVKTMPKEKGQLGFVLEANLFYKEMKFYTNLVSALLDNNIKCLQGCIPKCYLAILNNVLIFDDYNLEEYITLSSRISYNYETVLMIIRKLAKLHASFIILEERLSTKYKTTYRLNNYYKKAVEEGFYNNSSNCNAAIVASTKGTLTHIDLFPELYLKISQEVFKQEATKMISKMIENVQPSKKYRNTICHGDLWSNNILIKYQDGKPLDCIFVDFQTIRYCPPAHDLICFLYLSTDRKFRAKYMKDVIDYYYTEISKIFNNHHIKVNDVLPYEEFLSSCEDVKEFAVTQTVEHFHNIILTSDQVKELFSDQEYARQILFEDRSPFLKKMCENDAVFKEKMRECITDLKELCESKFVN